MSSHRVVVGLLLAVALTACKNNNPAPGPASGLALTLPPGYEQLETCLTSHAGTLMDALARFAAVIQQLEDPLNATIQVLPTFDPRQYSFDAGVLLGTATFNVVPTGGLVVGNFVLVSWDFQRGSVDGSGQLTFTLESETTVSVHGHGSWTDRDHDCVLDIDIPPGEPLVIDLSGVSALAQSGTCAFGGADIVGSIIAGMTDGQSEWGATLVFEAGATAVQVTDNTIDGVPQEGWTIPCGVASGPGTGGGPGGVVADWSGTWAVTYTCSGGVLPQAVHGTATLEIMHAAGATTFTGTEVDPDAPDPLDIEGVVRNATTATVVSHWMRDGRPVRETQTLTLSPDGLSFSKTGTAVFEDDGTKVLDCTGDGTKQ